jgi:Pyruvate/2-oxoacid:ferredoxin oxidoreductase delta subunit/flavodoxin
MKIAFVYFSSTGITPKFASEIAQGISTKVKCTFDYLRVKKGEKWDLSTYDLIGIGAPSYSFRAPRLMTRLLRRMNFNKKSFFVFATYNSRAGNTLWNLYRAVKRTAGVCLGFIRGSVAVNIRAWNPKKSSDRKLKKMSDEVAQQASKFGKELVSKYNQLEDNPKQKQPREWIPPVKILVVIWSLFLTWSWEMLCTVGIKHVDKKKCTRCKKCAEIICPSKTIRLSKNNLPRFVEIFCVGCGGCVNLCPQDAIWTFQTRNRKPYDLYKEFILKDSKNWNNKKE